MTSALLNRRLTDTRATRATYVIGRGLTVVGLGAGIVMIRLDAKSMPEAIFVLVVFIAICQQFMGIADTLIESLQWFKCEARYVAFFAQGLRYGNRSAQRQRSSVWMT